MSQYNRLSDDAHDCCSGDVRLILNGRDIGPGRQPGWKGPDIIAADPDVGIWLYSRAQNWKEEKINQLARVNNFAVSAAGYAYYTTVRGPEVVRGEDGRSFAGYADMAIGPRGELALKRHALPGALDILLDFEGLPTQLTPLATSAPRWTDAGLMFNMLGPPVRAWLWTYENGLVDVSLRHPVDGYGWPTEHAVCAVLGPSGRRWVLTAANEHLAFRPKESSYGYWLPSMENADCRWHKEESKFRLVGTVRGTYAEEWIDPMTPRADLRPPTEIPAQPLITIHSVSPRIGQVPLDVSVDVRPEDEAGPINRVRVTATRGNARDSHESVEIPGPGVATLRLTQPGDYRIHAESFGPGGEWRTQRVRIVTAIYAEDNNMKPREQWAKEFTAVNEFYAAEGGLRRPGGMVLDGKCDVQAMIQWGYDLVEGQSLAQVVARIKQSEEYKNIHGF